MSRNKTIVFCLGWSTSHDQVLPFQLDMHWNPQLESQACDRIYRVGQKKPVFVHKFLCEDTVERRILDLQRKKLDLAEGVLTGARMTNGNKLTFEDLKSLFEIK